MPVDLGEMENFDESDDDSLFGAVWDVDFMEVVAKEDADLSFLDNNVLPAHPTEPDLPPSSENCRTQGPTFLSISEEQKAEFVNSMKNKNTAKKTATTTRQFRKWLEKAPRYEGREIETIEPYELDNYIGSFLLSMRKADGSEYEPDTLTSYHRGIDRYLKEKKYPYCMVTDKEFGTSRKVLSSKRKELKEKGMGNRPNAAEPLNATEENILTEKGCIRVESPRQLLNALWLNNTKLFGLRGESDNRKLKWGGEIYN